MQTLQVGSFQNYGNVSTWDYVRQNRLIVVSIFVFIIVLIFFSILLKKSNKKLETANAAKIDALEKLNYEVDVKDTFFSIISHDLRAPCSIVLGLTRLLNQKANTLSKEKLAEYSSNVHEAAQRLFTLLENLLEWSRLQMEGEEPDMKTISIVELVQETVDILGQKALEKGIVIETKIQETSTYADADMVKTVIRNLINNAIKFTPKDGTITISTSSQDGRLRVSISDTGVGMSNEQVNNVFSIDKKTSTNGTNGEKGTGLGLPLCKDLLKRNHGDIWAESESGMGSQFHFTLPTVKAG